MYETDASTAGAALSSSGSVVFTDDTISKILALSTTDNSTVQFDQLSPLSGSTVTMASGTDVAFITGSNTGPTNFVVNSDTPVLIFQGSGGVDVSITGGPTINDRIVVGSAGNDKIVIADARNTQIVLGTGDSTVVGGLGNDTIVAGLGNSTISGGGGHDIVQMHGKDTDYQTIVLKTVPLSAPAGQPQADGTAHVIITNSVTHVTTDVTGVQYVALDSNDALIFAESTVEAGVSALYHAAFGRTGESGGIEFWFDLAKQGLSLHDMAVGFSHSAEFAATASMSDTAFITALYQNTFNRTPDQGGLDYWLQQLHNGASRVDLLTSFASVAALNQDGSLHTEVTVVGHVTIVPNIV